MRGTGIERILRRILPLMRSLVCQMCPFPCYTIRCEESDFSLRRIPHLPPSPPQPPSTHRQSLQHQRLRSDEPDESHHAHHNANHIDDVIPIRVHPACSTTINTPMLVCLQRAVKRRGHRRHAVLEGLGERWDRGRDAGGDGEVVDELEDEEAGEGAAEVRDAVGTCVSNSGIGIVCCWWRLT